MEDQNKQIITVFIIAIVCFSTGAFFQSSNPGKLLPANYCNDVSEIPDNPETGFFNITQSIGSIEFFNEIKSYDMVKILSESDSMRPTIHSESQIIILFDVPEEQLKIGMIIGFGEDRTTHRIIRIEEDDEKRIYITKGDNNPFEDSFRTTYEDIEYVVGGVLF